MKQQTFIVLIFLQMVLAANLSHPKVILESTKERELTFHEEIFSTDTRLTQIVTTFTTQTLRQRNNLCAVVQFGGAA